MGAAAIPFILSAVSAGASMYNNQQVARKQDDELSRRLTMQSQRQGDADQAVAEALRARSDSTAAQDRQQAGGQYLDQVRAAQANATRGLGQVGAVSNAYQQQANDAALGVSDYSQQTADLMARIDAPSLQRQREARNDSRLALDLDQISRRSRTDDYLSQLRMQMIRPNAALELGSAALGAGAGFASNAGWGQESLAGIQAKAKVGADFRNANQKLNFNLQPKWRDDPWSI
jgi:hypothetical protein